MYCWHTHSSSIHTHTHTYYTHRSRSPQPLSVGTESVNIEPRDSRRRSLLSRCSGGGGSSTTTVQQCTAAIPYILAPCCHCCYRFNRALHSRKRSRSLVFSRANLTRRPETFAQLNSIQLEKILLPLSDFDISKVFYIRK